MSRYRIFDSRWFPALPISLVFFPTLSSAIVHLYCFSPKSLGFFAFLKGRVQIIARHFTPVPTAADILQTACPTSGVSLQVLALPYLYYLAPEELYWRDFITCFLLTNVF